MKLEFNSEQIAFRDEVRDFLKQSLPADMAQRTREGLGPFAEDMVAWQGIAHGKGWAAPNWPTEYGGTGWSPVQQYIFDRECARAGTPIVNPFNISMVGPVIYTFGNDAQKARFLPDVLSGKIFFCQGYSEPNSGSDLASLQTTARRDGDHYVVNGTKMWTTLAQHADWIFCLVRTAGNDIKQQNGISFLLMDLTSPGVRMTPIITIDGQHEVNQLFFDDVKVPVENLIGEENKGWSYAKMLLQHERTGQAWVGASTRRLQRLRAMAERKDAQGQKLLDDADFANRLADIEIELAALEFTELRELSAVSTGRAPGPESSILKMLGTRVSQWIDDLTVEAAGYYCLPYVRHQFEPGFDGYYVGPGTDVDSAPHYFNNRKATIFGGSDEIQKNIISKHVLGL